MRPHSKTAAITAGLPTATSYAELARQVGCSPAHVSHMALKLGYREKKEPNRYVNPWCLTTKEYEAMLYLCETGIIKLAADRAGICGDGIERRLYSAKRKMREPMQIKALLMFDRWHRRNEHAAD